MSASFFKSHKHKAQTSLFNIFPSSRARGIAVPAYNLIYIRFHPFAHISWIQYKAKGNPSRPHPGYEKSSPIMQFLDAHSVQHIPYPVKVFPTVPYFIFIWRKLNPNYKNKVLWAWTDGLEQSHSQPQHPFNVLVLRVRIWSWASVSGTIGSRLLLYRDHPTWHSDSHNLGCLENMSHTQITRPAPVIEQNRLKIKYCQHATWHLTPKIETALKKLFIVSRNILPLVQVLFCVVVFNNNNHSFYFHEVIGST